MKNTSLFRRVLSVVLVVAMLGSLLVPMASAENGKASQVEELTLTPIDRGAVGSKAEAPEPIEKEDHALTDVVRVSIVLEKASTLEAGFKAENIANNAAAKAYREGLRADQAAMTAKIEKAIGGKLDVKWNLTLAANNISANVLYGQIDTIKGIDGVKDVFLENRYEPQVATREDEPNNGAASYMIGSNLTWAAGYTGAGSKVAVIDTGIDLEHKSFSGEALEYALRQTAQEKGISYDEYVASLNLLTPESIDAVKDQLNANISSGADAYRNTKVGFGYNYVDKRADYIGHLQDSQGEHGSHVEGISAANRFVKEGEEFKPALSAVGTQGVAPDAQIVTMKVFGIGGGAYDSDYMVAIEDAIILGCDSANLSLGSGSAGFSFSGSYESVMNKLVANGTVVAMSAGNSYGWYDTPYDSTMYPYLYADDVNYATGGSPGSFTNSLGTASVDNLGQTGKPLTFGDLSVFYSETSGYNNAPIATLADLGELDYILFENTAVDANNVDLLAPYAEQINGKVVLCYRGSSSFYQKVDAAASHGAIGCVIINNQPGVINMNLADMTSHIPAVSILQSDGAAIIAGSEAVKDEEGNTLYYTGKMSVAKDLQVQVPEVTDTVTVSSFSSWGTPASMVLKPEILTPGGSIYSVWGANTGSSSPTQSHEDYEVMSGTSMASPQTAGMAAVLGQYIRDNGLLEKTGLTQRQLINSLLMSTAHPVFDADGNYWPVIRVGAGLGNVADAVSAKSYILMDESATMFPDSAKDGKVKVELGDDPEKTGEYSYSFTYYPLEGKREFTLRTDIFTQWLAGNAGYGMLQDQATTLIGSETTYEIDGETYEDSYLLEADVNKDGETNADDAQAILDYLTGKNDGTELDLAVADVDGDEKVSTYDAKLLLESAETPIVELSGPTKVTVNIKLSEEDKAFLLNYFTNGFYVQGYTYIDPVADEEGVLDVTHSIPIYGFCGNWTDPSMLDRSSPIDAAYGTGKRPYLANSNTNYLTLKDAEGATSIYMGNPYAIEEKFPAGKLAMNSAATIQAFNYLNIRNVATLGFAILDQDGKVLLAQANPTQMFAAYYYVNGAVWQNYNPRNYSVGKKLSAAGLKEGDKATVAFYALPEYYGILNAKLNGQVATTGGLDADGLKAMIEAGLIGDGATIKYDITIDDTAPEVKGAFRDLITGDITVKASDNAYIAYVGVMNKSGTKEYVGIVPEQSEPGAEIEVPLDLEGQSLPNEVTLLVADYAGNEAAFKVALGGSEDDNSGGTMIGFTSANGSVGAGNRALELNPEELYYASASDFGGVSVYSNVNFKVNAAEYVDGYVFMAADDGWFYAADVNALDEADPVGKYSDTTAQIFDMAYNYNDGRLYVLGSGNILYSMDLITGELTPVVTLVLNGVSGTYAVANKLAIDDKGIAYVANYGGTSQARLFKFAIPEVEEEEAEEPSVPAIYSFGFETDPAEAGWTFLDKDADGYNWSVDTATSPAAYEGSNKIVSASYQNGARTPDNWAISPAIDITGLEQLSLSIFAMNYSSSFLDTVALYAGTTANVDEMTKVSEDIKPDTAWTEYTADLSAFQGESELYVAIRHYNCTDMWRVYVDSVSVRGAAPVEEPDPTEPEPVVIPELAVDAIGLMSVYNYSYGGALAWDHDNDILYFAGNWNATTDTDHNLFTLNLETGRATKVGPSGKSNPGRFYVCLSGLFIIPGGGSQIQPTDEAIELVVEPETLNLLKGQSVQVKSAVLPWTLTDKSITWESADETVATVKDGLVTGMSVGETTITVTTVAEPNLSKEITVTVEEAPAVELRGIIWDENGKGQASVFNTNDTTNWTAEAQVGAFRFGALVDDKVYGSTDDTMFYYDADTYEVTTLGGIVSDWIPSDAIAIPEDMVLGWGLDAGFRLGGLCYNGGYFEVLNPEAGSLNYWNLSSAYSADPMAVITIIERGDFTVSGESLTNALHALMITESGHMWDFYFDMEGSLYRVDTGKSIDLSLEGVSDVTNETWASLHYSEDTNFLYLSLYNGADDYAHLYAIDYADPSRMGEVGNFNANVWPVVGLHEYEPATDLALKVSPLDITVFEGETAELNIKVKLGETNEYTVEIADPSVISFEDGVITGLKEGETTLTVTTVDSNAAGEQLSETVNVRVKGYTSIDAFMTAQVTDENGARFAKLNLAELSASKKGPAAPGNVSSGARTGDIYMAGVGTSISALDAETYEPATYSFDSLYSEYPAMDIANYPMFSDSTGALDEHKALFTTNLGWLVTPDYYGWNLSSVLPDMAGIAFIGTGENAGTATFDYLLMTTAGVIYYCQVDYAAGRISYSPFMETGITVTDQSALSLAFLTTANVHGDYDVDLAEQGLVIANNEDKRVYYVDLTAETLELGLLGTLDAENISGLVGTFDDLATVTDAEPAPEPPVIEGNTIFAEDFEDGLGDWTLVNADGDNYNWTWNQNVSSWFSADGQPDFDSMAYEGTGCALSASFINTVGALTPDNWMVSPAIDLTEAAEDVAISFYAKGLDPSYAAEHFAIYAGTSANTAEMTQILPETVATGNWVQYSASLADFAGEDEVYVAIRHFNVTDQYILELDSLEIMDQLTEVEPGAAQAPAADIASLKNVPAKTYEAPKLPASNIVRIGDGFAVTTASAAVGYEAETLSKTRMGESVNAAVGGTNAVKGEIVEFRKLADETLNEEGTVKVVLSEDAAVTNGLIKISYDPEVLTFVDAMSELQLSSINEAEGVICFAYASVEEIAAGTALATLNFSYSTEADVNTEITVETLERNDNVAVAEEALVIPVTYEVPEHVHTYGDPVWTWNEDLTEAKATFTCEAGDDNQELDAVISSEVTTEPTDKAEGVKTITAKVIFQEKEYTDVKTQAIAKLEHDCPCAMFEDMPEFGTTEHDAIDWAFTHDPQITKGIDDTHFAPEATVTRGQAVTFLWRAAGQPKATNTTNPFVDAKKGSYYYKAMLWAVESGIVKGTDETHFAPNDTCTKEQILTFIYRYMKSPKISTSATTSPYEDVKYKGFSYKAILWAVENGIEAPKEETVFGAKDPCRRVDTVTYLYRIMTGEGLLNQ